MSFVEFIKEIGSSLSKLLGDDPRFRVNYSDEVELVTELGKSGMSKKEAAEVVSQYRRLDNNGKKYSSQEENAVNLDYDDQGYKEPTTVPDTEKSTSFREDSTFAVIRKTGIKNTPANELPNNERQHGGRSREARTK